MMVDSEYKKSSSCIIGGCLEARIVKEDKEDFVEVKNCEGKTLRFSPEAWKTFLQGVKSGEFDI